MKYPVTDDFFNYFCIPKTKLEIEYIMKQSMYDTLLLLPLFQGISRNQLTFLLEKMKFNFEKVGKNKVIAAQGQKCTDLIFVLQGKVKSQFVDVVNKYSIFEFYEGQMLIEPHVLMGMDPVYSATYVAETECGILKIDKRYMIDELIHYDVLMMNYINMLCSYAQSRDIRHRMLRLGDTYQKIIAFIEQRCEKQTGKKIIKVNMVELAHLVDAARIYVSRVLNEWNEKGLIELHRKSMIIPALEKLVEAYEISQDEESGTDEEKLEDDGGDNE